MAVDPLSLIVLTFGSVLALIVGPYWLLVVRKETAEQQALQKRMRPPDPAKRGRLTVPKAERRDDSGPAIFRGLQSVVDQSGLKLTVPALLFLCWMSGFFAGLMIWMLRPDLTLAAPAGAFGLFVPFWWVRYKATARMWKFEEQFPEAIDLIARALRAGHAFPTGLSMVADEVGSPVGPEFKLLYDRQNFGMPLPEALKAFAARVPLLDARFFVTAVLTQREAGGNLSGVLDNLSSVIRERFKVKRQVKVISAHGRMTAAVLMGLPPTVALAQLAIAPQNAEVLFADPLGRQMLIGAAVLQGIGMLIIRKIVKVEY
jgi:tight adherence protein B